MGGCSSRGPSCGAPGPLPSSPGPGDAGENGPSQVSGDRASLRAALELAGSPGRRDPGSGGGGRGFLPGRGGFWESQSGLGLQRPRRKGSRRVETTSPRWPRGPRRAGGDGACPRRGGVANASARPRSPERAGRRGIRLAGSRSPAPFFLNPPASGVQAPGGPLAGAQPRARLAGSPLPGRWQRPERRAELREGGRAEP